MDLKKIIEFNVKTDWKDVLLAFPGLNEISVALTQEVERRKAICPPNALIFNAFNHFNVKDLRVVILGQDPYHTPDVANGLAFSTSPVKKTPPSLVNIYKEVKRCYPEYDIPKNGDLSAWADQGILLLNTALTVREHEANSHSKMWQTFSNYIIRYISTNTEGKIFILWGGNARAKKMLIDDEKHEIMTSGHPSPLSIKHFENCGHFKKINDLLEVSKDKKINW